MNPDEILTEPQPTCTAAEEYDPTEEDVADQYDDDPGGNRGPPPPLAQHEQEEELGAEFGVGDGAAAPSRGRGGGGGGGRASGGGGAVAPRSVLEVGIVHRAAVPAGMLPSGDGGGKPSTSLAGAGGRNATLERYFVRPGRSSAGGAAAAASSSSSSSSSAAQRTGSRHGEFGEGGVLARAAAPAAAAAAAASSAASATAAASASSSSSYPWSADVSHHLRRTFRIQSFRDHQGEIIDSTMSGQDVFVVMRTGGGKSLTYQLPALIEGRGPSRKVTLVVSPLISLIRDQEEQMNGFAPGSALSFTSGMGTSEHARRWAQVRDPDGGVCLVLVTPEKVHKSNRLRSELERLNASGRLGRFVIDEAHCACQWGHDFRPDYTKLGLLKAHFPAVPVIAVTATASERVRDDVVRILRIGTRYRLFRSTADRPNLRYSIRPKPEGGQAVVDDMVEFIRTDHPSGAGIVYTFSRREADDVAGRLCDAGIVARSYHSDVGGDERDMVHRSWMRDETQVVVATIAFGLGINKPDVRFVLHHSISKSMEGYYQESGRAGRDGLPADCVLYYSTRDVSRTLGMIHGQHGEGGFWSMVRYAQTSGDDALCRAFILATLGEPGAEHVDAVVRRGCDATEPRQVGGHAKVAATLLREAQAAGEDLTPPQLVTRWRSKNPPECVKANPPGNDLTKDECDRLVVALILERVFKPRVVFNAYGSNVYVCLGQKGEHLVRSTNADIVTHFPKRKKKAAPKKARGVAAAQAGESGWISAKKKTPARSKKGRGSKASVSRTGKTKKTGRSSSRGSTASQIIILSSSDEDSIDENSTAGNNKKRPSESVKQISNKKSKKKSPFGGLDSDDDSDFTFD